MGLFVIRDSSDSSFSDGASHGCDWM